MNVILFERRKIEVEIAQQIDVEYSFSNEEEDPRTANRSNWILQIKHLTLESV